MGLIITTVVGCCVLSTKIVVQSDCGKIYRDSNYSEMSLVVCNERSIATSSPKEAACYVLGDEMKV